MMIEKCGRTRENRIDISSSIRFLPKLVEFLLEAFFERGRCTDQCLEGHFLVHARLQRHSSLKHCLQEPLRHRFFFV